MTFRRRSFSHRKAGFPREPVLWDRANSSLYAGSNVKDTAAGATIWAPGSDIAGSPDTRSTHRRIMCSTFFVFELAGGTLAVGDVYEANIGIYMGGAGETTRDPSLAAASDENVDWLFLESFPIGITAAPQGFVHQPIRNAANQPGLIDLKTMRKIDQDQRIFISVKVRGTDLVAGHAPATIVVYSRAEISALWQRTMRR